MNYKIRKRNFLFVIILSASSRIFYILLAKLSYKMFEPFDYSEKVLKVKYFRYLLRWDAILYREIILNGYQREQLTVFFPLFPAFIKLISNFLGFNEYFEIGVIINNIIFIFSALILYFITIKRYGYSIALLSVFFFSFNPASIVFSSLYTESLFAFIFLIGFYMIESKKTILSFLLFSLTSMIRSNGILFSLFFFEYPQNPYLTTILNFTKSITIFMPFLLIQIFNYRILGLKSLKIPYSYVQSKYWEQGFLQFYNYKKNIPNFFAGFPFILYSMYIISSFISSKFFKKGKFTTIWLRKRNITYTKNKNTFILVLILFIQSIMGLLFIHMQMFFRFVSYNPFIYWCMALQFGKGGVFFKTVVYGYLFYGIAYAILFGAYYPPA